MEKLEKLYAERETLENLRDALKDAIRHSEDVTGGEMFDFSDMTEMLAEHLSRTEEDLRCVNSQVMIEESEEQAAMAREYWKAVI